MMLDEVHPRAQRLAGKRARDPAVDARGFAHVAEPLRDETEVGPLRCDIKKPPPQVRFRIFVDRDVIDVTELHARFFQTKPHRLTRQTGPVFNAPESLFLGGGDQFSVAEDARRRVAVIGVESENDHFFKSENRTRVPEGNSKPCWKNFAHAHFNREWKLLRGAYTTVSVPATKSAEW